MKKALLTIMTLVTIALVFVSCNPITTPIVGYLKFLVVAYNAGPELGGAFVTATDGASGELLGFGTTNADGEVQIGITRIPDFIDVEVLKEGTARSLLQGLKAQEALDGFVPLIAKPAKLDGNPESQVMPDVQLTFFDLLGNPLDPTQPIIADFVVHVQVNSENHMSGIYEPLLGRVAGAGLITTDRDYFANVTEADFIVPIAGFAGDTPLHAVIYDYNDNRVQKVVYLDILPPVVAPIDPMYEVMPFTQFSNWFFVDTLTLENMWSYTRRNGIAFNGLDDEIVSVPKREARSEGMQALAQQRMDSMQSVRVAPENGNLWTHLYWTDWSSAAWYAESYPGDFPVPLAELGPQPDGYNVYRSVGGAGYQKIGFVSEAYLAYISDAIAYYIAMGYPITRIMNMFPCYKDSSAFLTPGISVAYKVAAVYGSVEGPQVSLGSVTPLDSFNINLEAPADEERGVSRNPNFQWSPTKALTSGEGVVNYHYSLFIYDWIQADNGLFIPGTYVGEDTVAMFDFVSPTAGAISADFTGNAQDPVWGTDWFMYMPYTDSIAAYPFPNLEPGKTYGWGINIAYGLVKDNDSRSYSISADYKYRDAGFYIDPVGVLEPDLHADFTTATN